MVVLAQLVKKIEPANSSETDLVIVEVVFIRSDIVCFIMCFRTVA